MTDLDPLVQAAIAYVKIPEHHVTSRQAALYVSPKDWFGVPRPHCVKCNDTGWRPVWGEHDCAEDET